MIYVYNMLYTKGLCSTALEIYIIVYFLSKFSFDQAMDRGTKELRYLLVRILGIFNLPLRGITLYSS